MEKNIYAKMLEAVAEGESVALKTEIKGTEGDIADGIKRSVGQVESTVDAKGFNMVTTTAVKSGEDFYVSEPILPKERLIILGGGHIALPVCEFAAKCGFEVHVCDDRPAFANEERFPWAKEVLCDTFENCIEKLKITPYDYVVIITRGHVHDGDCLRAILPGQAAYISRTHRFEKTCKGAA